MKEYIRLLPMVFDPNLAAQIGEAVIGATRPLLQWCDVLESVPEESISGILVPYSRYGIKKNGSFLWAPDVMEFLETQYGTSVLALTNLEVLQEDGTLVYGHHRLLEGHARPTGGIIVSSAHLLRELEARDEETGIERIVSQALHEIGEFSGLEEHGGPPFPNVKGKLCPMVVAKSFMETTGRTSADYLKTTGIGYCSDCKNKLLIFQ